MPIDHTIIKVDLIKSVLKIAEKKATIIPEKHNIPKPKVLSFSSDEEKDKAF